MSKMNFVPITVDRIFAVTDKAAGVAKEGERVWIPRSSLSSRSDQEVEDMFDDDVTLEVHDWFAKKKGWA